MMINLPPFHNDPTGDDWAGMTLQEIQMRRALVQARMEVQKFKLNMAVERLQNNNPLGNTNSWLTRVAGAFSWVEYAFMAFKIFKWFRNRKK